MTRDFETLSRLATVSTLLPLTAKTLSNLSANGLPYREDLLRHCHLVDIIIVVIVVIIKIAIVMLQATLGPYILRK